MTIDIDPVDGVAGPGGANRADQCQECSSSGSVGIREEQTDNDAADADHSSRQLCQADQDALGAEERTGQDPGYSEPADKDQCVSGMSITYSVVMMPIRGSNRLLTCLNWIG